MNGPAPQPSLFHVLREHRFHCRLERARIIRDSPPGEERRIEAGNMLRELALRRVWDRFSQEQEAEIAALLEPIASLPAKESPGQQHLF